MPLRTWEYIGVPFDWGASKRGCRLGPDALRALEVIAALRAAGIAVQDGGNVSLPPVPPVDEAAGPANLNRLEQVAAMAAALAERVENALMLERFPVIIGGDHSIALGSIAGAARVVQPLGLLWIDAHGDFNDARTSPSGNIHGMPLSAVVGQGAPELNTLAGPAPKVLPEHAVLIGVRDLDVAEAPKLAGSGVVCYTAQAVHDRGMGPILAEALEIVTSGTAGFHCSFDVDSLDPAVIPGTGTRSPEGLTLDDGLAIIRACGAAPQCRSIELTELNPLLDHEGQSCRAVLALLIALAEVMAAVRV